MPLEAKCPICRNRSVQGEDHFPFCSERCQKIDLGNWSSEEYRIPGERVDPAYPREEDADNEVRRR